VLAIGAGGGSIVSNQILHNRLYGIGLRAVSHHFSVSGNTFRNNKTMYFGVTNTTTTPITVAGVSTASNPKTTWHMEITSDCYSNSIGTNYYAQ
jgi:nitrous oxidase accessory protein NosD